MASVRWVPPLPLLRHQLPPFAPVKNTPEGLLEQSRTLTNVRDVAELRRQVELDYLDSLRLARAAGCSIEQIGMAAGVTRQTIYKILGRVRDGRTS